MSSANKRQASASESDSVNLPEDVLALDSIFKYNENNYDSYPSSPKRKKAKIATSGSASKPLPNSSNYIPLVLGGSQWNGLKSFESFIVIGDSYSCSELEGTTTWVGCLRNRIRTQNKDTQLRVCNFAFPGATAEIDLSVQLSRYFEQFKKKKTPDSPPALDPDTSTYLFFLGINDCGSTDSDELELIVESLFDALHSLYTKSGARNFVIIDVPPVHRSPQAVTLGEVASIEERIETWNDLLHSHTTTFGTSYKEATIFLFSSNRILTEILDDPCEYGFDEDDADIEGGEIWEDDLHLTTEVHEIIVDRLVEAIFSGSELELLKR